MGTKLDPNNYASIEPLDPEELLEKLAEFQRDADSSEAKWLDLKEQAKEEKAKFDRLMGKVAMIGRAREAVHNLYLLKGGELTDDEPDTEGSLPLGYPVDGTADVQLDLGDDPPAEVEASDAPKDVEYPPEQDGQVYQAKSSQGNTCTVKQQAGGWYGRVSGKPIAKNQPGALAAMGLVNDHVKESLVWAATLVVAAADVAGAPPEDLTGGL